jgi:hypothetical protein
MAKLRHVAFGASAERDSNAEKNQKPRNAARAYKG